MPPRLNAARYLTFLRHDMPPLLEELPAEVQADIIYQHDGAPAHFGRQVRNYLDERFPENWIGRRGPVEWPARSPDLTPPDFFLWGHIKNFVYKEPVTSEEDVMGRLHEAFATIDEEMVAKAVNNVRKRSRSCLEQEGGHFEQFLKRKRMF